MNENLAMLNEIDEARRRKEKKKVSPSLVPYFYPFFRVQVLPTSLRGRGGGAIFVRYATVGQFTKNAFSSFSESAGRQTN